MWIHTPGAPPLPVHSPLIVERSWMLGNEARVVPQKYRARTIRCLEFSTIFWTVVLLVVSSCWIMFVDGCR